MKQYRVVLERHIVEFQDRTVEAESLAAAIQLVQQQEPFQNWVRVRVERLAPFARLASNWIFKPLI